MKLDESVEYAFKAGFELVNSSIYVDGVNVTDEIALLVNLVEQATLERAAKIAETCDLYEGDYLRNSDPRKTIAHEIRAEMYD